jgi:hypothetical protein
MDRGLILHLAHRYQDSIKAFEAAKVKADDLYTRSISKGAATWLVNDYLQPYYGEDFERVLIHIFQSLNYAALGDVENALIEARQVDSKLRVINAQYPQGRQNVYREDGFARFLMGIFYEEGRTPQDLNDAFISYAQSVDIYEKFYLPNYHVRVPEILKANILTLAKFMGPMDAIRYRSKFNQFPPVGLADKNKKAEVYLIQYNGLAPVKRPFDIPVPLPDGYITKFAFVRYEENISDIRSSFFKAVTPDGKLSRAPSELGEDIRAIAIQDLESKRLRVLLKAGLRPLVKYGAERAIERQIEQGQGKTPAVWFRVAGSLFNIFSEQADLRGWQTLPAEIRIARLLLAPGTYHFSVENFNEYNQAVEEVALGQAELKAGEKKFFIIRSVK